MPMEKRFRCRPLCDTPIECRNRCLGCFPQKFTERLFLVAYDTGSYLVLPEIESTAVSFNTAGFCLGPDDQTDAGDASVCVAFVEKKDFTEATRQFSEALRILPHFSHANNSKGVALAKQGKTVEAMIFFRAALRADPNYAEAHNNLGVLLNDQNQIQDSIRHCLMAVKLKPNYAKAHHNLGIALFQIGKIKPAISHFKKALRINPNDRTIRENLQKAKEAYALISAEID